MFVEGIEREILGGVGRSATAGQQPGRVREKKEKRSLTCKLRIPHLQQKGRKENPSLICTLRLFRRRV